MLYLLYLNISVPVTLHVNEKIRWNIRLFSHILSKGIISIYSYTWRLEEPPKSTSVYLKMTTLPNQIKKFCCAGKKKAKQLKKNISSLSHNLSETTSTLMLIKGFERNKLVFSNAPHLGSTW